MLLNKIKNKEKINKASNIDKKSFGFKNYYPNVISYNNFNLNDLTFFLKEYLEVKDIGIKFKTINLII